MPPEDRLDRLARRIEARAREDERVALRAEEIAAVRRQAALALHALCAEFVASVNRLLPDPLLELAPPEYTEASFHDTGSNLIQVNSRGRVLQVAFQATDDLVSTRKYRIPYTLEGELRAYNQSMLERGEIEDYLVFFCVEKNRNGWRFFDWRTNRHGLVDRDLLLTVMEHVV